MQMFDCVHWWFNPVDVGVRLQNCNRLDATRDKLMNKVAN